MMIWSSLSMIFSSPGFIVSTHVVISGGHGDEVKRPLKSVVKRSYSRYIHHMQTRQSEYPL
jgi:hypothetical protein